MTHRKLVLVAVTSLVGVVALAGIGLAVAQTASDGDGGMVGGNSGTGDHGAMMGSMAGQMSSGMADHGAMMGQMGAHHEQMLATTAAALGITVDELQAELDSGKTIPEVAAERGVDLTSVWDAMHANHPSDHGQAMSGGMMGATGNGEGCPAHAS